jgi:hypothetical protein
VEKKMPAMREYTFKQEENGTFSLYFHYATEIDGQPIDLKIIPLTGLHASDVELLNRRFDERPPHEETEDRLTVEKYISTELNKLASDLRTAKAGRPCLGHETLASRLEKLNRVLDTLRQGALEENKLRSAGSLLGRLGLISLEAPHSRVSHFGKEFYGCEKLTTLSFSPDSTFPTINDSAFTGCNNLVELNIPTEQLTRIGKHAFLQCRKLPVFTFGRDLEEIGAHAFDNCKSLQGALVLPPSLTTVEIAAFKRTGYSSVIAPASLDMLPEDIFARCENLSKVTLHGNVKAIGSYAFENCPNLREIYFKGHDANTDTIILDDTFKGCKDLTIYCGEAYYQHTLRKSKALLNPEITVITTNTHGQKCWHYPAEGERFECLETKDLCAKQTYKYLRPLFLTLHLTELAEKTEAEKIAAIIKHEPNITPATLEILSPQLYKWFKSTYLHFTPPLNEELAYQSEDQIRIGGVFHCSLRLTLMLEQKSNASRKTIQCVNKTLSNREPKKPINLETTSVQNIVEAERYKRRPSNSERSLTASAERTLKTYEDRLIAIKTKGAVSTRAFAGDKNLTEINLPLGETAFAGSKFRHCADLTRIEDEAFADCPQLASVSIPSTVIAFGNNIFSGCSGLTVFCSEATYALITAHESNCHEGICYVTGHWSEAKQRLLHPASERIWAFKKPDDKDNVKREQLLGKSAAAIKARASLITGKPNAIAEEVLENLVEHVGAVATPTVNM